MPFFSIIIPTFNRAALLREALASVARQTFRDFEVIVVDDGSRDETESVVNSCDLPVTFLRQENRGPGAARNLAIQHSQGRYIAFLDSDDQWLPWTLAIYQRIIVTQNQPAFMSGLALPLDGRPASPAMEATALDIRSFSHLLEACTDRVPPVGGTPSICLNRLALEETGGFASRKINGEDTDLWLRLGLKPGFVRILNPPVFLQRKHSGNVTNQLEPSLAGARYLMHQERTSAFPGGKAYRQKRRRIICGTVRSLSLECLQAGRPADACSLYFSSFAWNLGLANLKYLAGFPLLAAGSFANNRFVKRS